MNTPKPDRPWICAPLLALLLAAGILPARAGLKAGDAFPDLAAQKLEGKLPEALKGKIVLVDFWASWCGPCAQSFPAMEELHKRYKERGFVILAVSVDEQAADLQAFLKKRPVSFAVVRDAEHKLVTAADVSAMPTSFLLDAKGKIRFVHTGYHGDATKKQYAEEIEALLKEKP